MFQTGIQPPHHTGSVGQEELSTFDPRRGQRKRSVPSGAHSAVPLTSKQAHTERVCSCLKEEIPSIQTT